MKTRDRLISVILCMALAVTGAAFWGGVSVSDAQASATKKSVVNSNKELRGLWVGYCDFQALGLTNKSKKTFTANTRKLMKRAKKNGCNVIFFHVRAFDDASWKSKTFPASKYIKTNAKRSKSAYSTYTYDPLQIMITEAHAQGLELHAWINPYRITQATYLDPKKLSSRNRVLRAIKEVQKYDVDGIHFDDYFYHGKKYVKTSNRSKRYSVRISAKKKRAYVNKLVKAAYRQTHKKKNMVFGISPQGNYENDMNDGADVKTWMKKTGYIDYIIPQIYWTDNWGARGNVKMFTNRLNTFTKLKKNSAKLYIGLALYRTGYKASDDKGWAKRSTNIRNQVKLLRKKGAKGYSLYTAPNLTEKHASKELKNLRKYLGI